MIYIDTSAIVKLYIKEPDSRKVSEWIRINNNPIPLTRLIELELLNALKLKQFRKEICEEDFDRIDLKLKQHEASGVYYRPPMDWAVVFHYAFDLSKAHTPTTGSRSLDIMHVASALFLKADKILTFDDRQSQLAAVAGLKTENVHSID
ncbi:MAG: type II toxin-antitoxin system VapC family toxin [Desulfobacteraceae bacterium]|nr:type II toxin-antitoxin system VapC family toxin [Desulfobacteraceae bacterium]MBU4052839.1 type II toxin-antitoxin system VapC family toxin [Pseudomonadota bacterium]